MDCAHHSRPSAYKVASWGLSQALAPAGLWTVTGEKERLQVVAYWRNDPYFPSPFCRPIVFLPSPRL